MSATKPTNGWNGTAAISGECTSGANVNGGSTDGVNTIETTMVTGTAITATGIAIEAFLKIVEKRKNGAPLSAPRSFFGIRTD